MARPMTPSPPKRSRFFRRPHGSFKEKLLKLRGRNTPFWPTRPRNFSPRRKQASSGVPRKRRHYGKFRRRSVRQEGRHAGTFDIEKRSIIKYMVFIYSTCRDIEEARKLSKLMVERKIAACVNMWPIESCYTWEGGR